MMRTGCRLQSEVRQSKIKLIKHNKNIIRNSHVMYSPHIATEVCMHILGFLEFKRFAYSAGPGVVDAMVVRNCEWDPHE